MSVVHDRDRAKLLGQRDDLSSERLKDLLSGSIDVVRRRLVQVVKPERQAAIEQAAGATALNVGKPARRFFDLALAALGLEAAEVAVVRAATTGRTTPWTWDELSKAKLK